MGYQEVLIAGALGRLGYRIRVFTSTKLSKSGKKVFDNDFEPGLHTDSDNNVEIMRLETAFTFRSIVYSSGLKKAVEDFAPDILILTSIGKLFPAPLLKIKSVPKIGTILGESFDNRDKTSFLNKLFSGFLDLAFKLIKSRYYNKAMELSDKVFLNLPETEELMKGFLNKKGFENLVRKKKLICLGYDERIFGFDDSTSVDFKKSLNINDNATVLFTHTKVDKVKELEKIINAVDRMIDEGINIYYIIIGFINNSYSDNLRKEIASLKNKSRFILLPFMKREDMVKYMNISDVGIWVKPTITILEAMGTGMPALLPRNEEKYHFVKEGLNGWFFSEGKLYEKLKDIISDDSNFSREGRKKIQSYNMTNLSVTKIASNMIEELEKAE